MSNIYYYLKENYLFLIIIVLLLFIGFLQIFSLFKTDNNTIKNDNLIALVDENNIKNDEGLVNVDIKGAVKKQGVYKMSKELSINDVIKKAGGLKRNATTIDINLSKQVYNEMVIYISTKNEYKNRLNLIKCNQKDDNNKANIASKESFVSDYNNTTANKVISNDTSNNNYYNYNNDNNDNNVSNEESYLVNINKANKDEMTKIPGIGEAKADKIIAYRNENGLFKSIEDIKNVSGIGQSIYDKIKDYITI